MFLLKPGAALCALRPKNPAQGAGIRLWQCPEETPPPAMTITAPLPSLKRHQPFALFWTMRVTTTTAYMMQSVAVGWQIYDMTGNALDLGLVGLVQFVPLFLLAVVVGQIIDRYDRRAIARTCQIVKAVCALLLAYGSARGWLGRDAMFAILLVVGVARAFETPTLHALLPSLVPPLLLPRAIAASASAGQTAIICGPALGGLIYAFGPTTVYVCCAVVFTGASVLVSLLPRPSGPPRPLGGVTALLPIYARDILETGPWGLGLLRSGPAIGALLMSIWLAHFPIERRAGLLMFASTGMFGLAIVAFALSRSLLLSILALVVYGASDAVSVVIRMALVQMRTPSEMLGRVMAVNSMFTGSSGALGEFRAGVIAAGFGAVASALVGGCGALLMVLLWMRLFPDLAHVKRIAPEAAEAERSR